MISAISGVDPEVTFLILSTVCITASAIQGKLFSSSLDINSSLSMSITLISVLTYSIALQRPCNLSSLSFIAISLPNKVTLTVLSLYAFIGNVLFFNKL